MWFGTSKKSTTTTNRVFSLSLFQIVNEQTVKTKCKKEKKIRYNDNVVFADDDDDDVEVW